jgi:hypothetical protein
MIKEVKDILREVILGLFPGMTVVRSAKEESQAIMGRQFPLVALITNPGKFDDRRAKTYRYGDGAGNLVQQQVRGNRQLPLMMRVWAEGEEATDALFSAIIPAIPRVFSYDGFEGTVTIAGEEHSDHAGNTSRLFVSVAAIEFAVDVATAPEAVPVIAVTDTQPERIGF